MKNQKPMNMIYVQVFHSEYEWDWSWTVVRFPPVWVDSDQMPDGGCFETSGTPTFPGYIGEMVDVPTFEKAISYIAGLPQGNQSN